MHRNNKCRIPLIAKINQKRTAPLNQTSCTLRADTKSHANIEVGHPFSPKQETSSLLRSQILNCKIHASSFFLLEICFFRIRLWINLLP